MSAITIDNDLVHYEVLGRGRPVILIHGWLGSWRYWIPVMQQLSANYRVYALDLYGFGDSQKNPTRYSLQSQVALLTQFMEKLGINKAALVGHSFGAAIAVAFARRHELLTSRVMIVSAPIFAINGDALPSLPAAPAMKKTAATVPPVSGTSLSSAPAASTPKTSTGLLTAVPVTAPPTAAPSVVTTPPAEASPIAVTSPVSTATPVTTVAAPSPVPPASASTTEETLRRNPFLDHPEKLAHIGITPPTPAPNPLAGLMINVKPKALLERQLIRNDDTLSKLRDEVDKTDDAAVAESVRSFAGVNLALDLCQLAIPVLLLHGKSDPFIPAPEDDLLSRIGGGKTVGPFFPLVVPDFRHFPMLENTSKFNRLLMDFLDAKLSTDAEINLELRETWRRQLR